MAVLRELAAGNESALNAMQIRAPWADLAGKFRFVSFEGLG